MNRIFITGASGNVGKEILRHLLTHENCTITAGVRNALQQGSLLNDPGNVKCQHFDFEDQATFQPALANCDIMFLLRPPELSDVKKIFEPLITVARESAVKHIVFLSVQGVEKSRIIPHHKIEKIIRESNIPYTFLRPAYFMQNFTTTLLKDLKERKMIFLPAGKAKFTIIDTKDVGLVSAVVLKNPEEHENKSYELTNFEKLTFGEMAEKISSVVGTRIRYVSPNLLSFFIQKRKEKIPAMFIAVMIMLHYFPRFAKAPDTNGFVESLSGKQPTTFDEFVQENKTLLTPDHCGSTAM